MYICFIIIEPLFHYYRKFFLYEKELHKQINFNYL